MKPTVPKHIVRISEVYPYRPFITVIFGFLMAETPTLSPSAREHAHARCIRQEKTGEAHRISHIPWRRKMFWFRFWIILFSFGMFWMCFLFLVLLDRLFDSVWFWPYSSCCSGFKGSRRFVAPSHFTLRWPSVLDPQKENLLKEQPLIARDPVSPLLPSTMATKSTPRL